MRAGRLVSLLLMLQHRGQLTASEIATELEVSTRTVLRDIESLSGAGVPVYAVRGPGGGFRLMDGYETDLASPDSWSATTQRPGRPRRATVLVTDECRRLAAVLGVVQPLRLRRSAGTRDDGRSEATFRMASVDGTARELLRLGPEVEVLAPDGLRTVVSRLAKATADRYGET